MIIALLLTLSLSLGWYSPSIYGRYKWRVTITRNPKPPKAKAPNTFSKNFRASQRRLALNTV